MLFRFTLKIFHFTVIYKQYWKFYSINLHLQSIEIMILNL